MKKALSFILVLALVFSMIPAVYAAEAETLISLTDETVTASGYTYEYTAETAGTLNVSVGTCSPGWRYKVYFPDGTESIYRTKLSAGTSCDYEGEAGNWKIVFYAYSSSQADNVAGTVSFSVSFTASEGEDSGEVEKAEYEISETALALGDNTLTLLETAVTTIYVYKPEETGVYTFTAPEGAILGYWGAGSWLLSDPGSTTNAYEWTCTGVGQSAYIGISGAEGSFNLNVAKTGDYTVVETPIVVYDNKATLETFTLPEGSTLGSYIDVTAETTHEAILGDDGYYHLNSADGPVILVDMNYQDIVLSNALNSDRPVMYAYMTDEDGNAFKYDISIAIKEYEAVMDANGYYPLTEDLILFYDTYAVGAGTYTFYVTGSYNEDNVWMYCMRTVTFPEVTEPEETEPEETEPEATEPEATDPEVSEPEETEPEATEPEATEPEVSEPAASGTLISVTNEAVTASGYTYEYTAATAGTLHVSVGTCSPGWRYKVYSPDGIESGYRGAYTAGTECDYYNVAGNWKIVFYAYSSSEADNVEGTVSFTITFTPDGETPEETEPEATEPEATEPEATEPEATEPEATEPEATEPEATEPEATEPEVSEPAASGALISVTNEAVTASGYTFEYTAATAGTLHVSVGTCSPGWRYKVYSPDGTESSYRGVYSAGTECDYYNVAGNWKIVFYAYSSSEADNVEGTVSFTITFTPDEATGGETEKAEYEVSATELSVGSNTLTTLDTAVTTIYKFKPTEAGTYTITAPEGVVVGNWGSNAYYLVNPNSTANTCQWTCTGVGQSVFIGVSGVDGEFVLLVEQEADPTEPEVTEPEETEPEETEAEETEPETTTIPTIDDEDVPAGTVFSVTIDGQTTYFSTTTASSINTQLKKITGTGYVKFYQDVDLGTSISNALMFEAGNITVDLNSCTITFAVASVGAFYVNGGTLTVIDTSTEGDGLVQNTNTSGYGIEIWSGTAYLKSGSIHGGSNGVRLYNDDDFFYMEGGNVTAQRYAVNAPAYSTAHISGGTLQATLSNQYAVFAATNSSVTITGGYFNGKVYGAGLAGKISGGYFISAVTTSYIASGCELQSNDDDVYLYKVVDPNAVEPEPTEPEETEPEETEPEETEPEVTEPEVTEPEETEPEETEPEETEPEETEPEETEPEETEPEETEPEETEPEETEPEETEPAESGTLLTLTNETVTVSGYTFEYTAATAGILNVTVGTCSPGWRYKVYSPDGTESIYRTKWNAGESCDYEGEAGDWKIVFFAYSSSQADNVAGTVSFTVTFTPAEGGDSGEVEKAEYEVSETALALGDNTLTLLETAVTTIYVYKPEETGVYTFTAPEGAILGYWGAGSWLLSDPGSTTNAYEWTCTGVGQSAYIGISGAEGSFNLNVAKTGDYTVVETPIVVYENKATLENFSIPEGAILGSYIDVTTDEVQTAVLGDDGYYHLNSADGPVILVDMNYQDIVLTDVLKSDRPVMYAYMTDEDGNTFKYDIGAAVQEYEAVMDENGYYPLTEDLILFYDTYAVGAGTYTFYVTGSYNEDNVWMYCMRTVTLPVTPVNSWNLVLEDDLRVNFYLNITDPTTEQVKISIGEASITYSIADLPISENDLYTVSIRLAAAQMADEINIEIIGSDANYVAKTYTIRQYADTVLADEAMSQYHAIIKEMLNYGGAAQTYFGYNSDNLASTGIDGAGAANIPETTTDYVVEGSADGIDYYGASLVYRDKIAIRFYFTGSAEGIEGAVQKGDMFYIEVADILPQDYDKAVTVTVGGLTVSYSPMNYIVRMSQKDNENLTALLKALYNYHLAAKALREAV